MTDLSRRRMTGPLTPRQTQMMDLRAAGHRQTEVARILGITPQHVSTEVLIAVSKTGARSPGGAVARYAQAAAYRDAAKLLERGLFENPGGSEKAVNSVLEGMAAILRERAAKLLPT